VLSRRRLFVSTDGTRAALAQYDNDLHVWDLDAGKVVARLGGHWGDLVDGAFAADGRLATVGVDGALRVWDVAAQRATHELSLGQRDPLALAWDGDALLLLTRGGERWRWDEEPELLDTLGALDAGSLDAGWAWVCDRRVFRDGTALAEVAPGIGMLATVPGRWVYGVRTAVFFEHATRKLRVDGVGLSAEGVLVAQEDRVLELDAEAATRRQWRCERRLDDVAFPGRLIARTAHGELAVEDDGGLRIVTDPGRLESPPLHIGGVERARLPDDAATPPPPIAFRDVAPLPAPEQPKRSTRAALLDPVRPFLEAVAQQLRGGRGYREAGAQARVHGSGLELDVRRAERHARVRVTHDGSHYRLELVFASWDPPPERVTVRLARILRGRRNDDAWARALIDAEGLDVRVDRAGGRALTLMIRTVRLPRASRVTTWVHRILEKG